MAKWDIRSETERETEAIERWGQDEWDRRKNIVEIKKDELEAATNWETRCVIGTQFEAIARVMKQSMWDQFIEMPVRKWELLVHKLAGTI